MAAHRVTRSISLPLTPHHKKPSYHLRSVSLPCQSHPLTFNLEEQIQAVRSWAANPGRSIEAGLAQIELLQMALEDFLQLPRTLDLLRRRSAAAALDHLLDDLLHLIDLHGSFLSAMEILKQSNSEVQSALRRQDGAQMASSLKSHRIVEKRMARLVSGMKGMAKRKQISALSSSEDAKGLEMAGGVIVETICATAFASVAVFTGVGALSAAAMKALRTVDLNTSSLLKRRFITDVQKDTEAPMYRVL